MARQIGLLVFMVLLVGCTDNTRPAQNAQKKLDSDVQQVAKAHNTDVKDQDQKVVCHRVAPVGSRITHLECRTVWQMKEQEKDAKSFINKPRPFTRGNGN